MTNPAHPDSELFCPRCMQARVASWRSEIEEHEIHA